MRRFGLSMGVLLFSVSVAIADPLNYGWVNVPALPPRGPVGGAGPGPANVADTGAPVNPMPGQCFFYMVDNGMNGDNNRGSSSHFEIEGVGNGSFVGQSQLQWIGLNTMAADFDTAFGANQWTIQRIWMVLDEASFSFGDTGGCVAVGELNAFTPSVGSPSGNAIADFGNPTSGCSQTAVAQGIPLGYSGHVFTATAGGLANQSFLLYDGTGGPNLPAGSRAFTTLACNTGDDAVIPATDDFIVYLAPNDDFGGGAGADVALSFDGFFAGTFGFSPMLVFEVCMRNAQCTSNSLPVADDAGFNAPLGGGPCTYTLTGSDSDDPPATDITFSITGGSGNLVLTGSVTKTGVGTYAQDATYTVAGTRGIESFTFKLNDTINDGSEGTVNVNVRGNATQNSIAFGANNGDVNDTARLYTGDSVPFGGTAGTRDNLAGQPFIQSIEFDNHNGILKNPAGNILALTFGPPGGPGALYVYASQASCNNPGGIELIQFPGDRVVSLSVNPSNNKVAVYGTLLNNLYILDYAVGPDVGLGGANAVTTMTLSQTIGMGAFIIADSHGTEWKDDNTVLVSNDLGELIAVDITGPSLSVFASPPSGLTITNVSTADVTFNPDVSPNIYVTIGEFTGGMTFNWLYIVDSNGNVVPQPNSNIASMLYSTFDPGGSGQTFREAAFDCFGNLFIGTFGGAGNNEIIYYIQNAADPAAITGTTANLTPWRDGDGFSNFTGLDVAAGGSCANAPPTVLDEQFITSKDISCTVTLTGTDNDGERLTFNVTNPGSNGGTLTLIGVPMTVGNVTTQEAVYMPVMGFSGEECFDYTANDGVDTSNVGQACFQVRCPVVKNTVAFGGSEGDVAENMRLYFGDHTPGGGTAGVEEVLGDLTFTQSVEFDNFDGVLHNPEGNLLGLNFGTTAGGGDLYVYATQPDCNGEPGFVVAEFNGMPGNLPLSRVTGISVSPDNTKLAIYGYDTFSIYVLDYTVGVDVGRGGAAACSVSLSQTIDLSAIITVNETLGTAWLDDNTILWIDQNGNLYTVPLAGVPTLVRPNPNPASAISVADIEYNPEISDVIAVVVGEFSGGTTNTLYLVDRDGVDNIPGNGDDFSIIQQSGADFTDHSAAGTGTFREIAWDCDGNLFLGTFADGSNRVNIRYFGGLATNPGGVTNDSSIIWNEMDAGQELTNFSGLDVALGSDACDCPGDLNGDGNRDGLDVQGFVDCLLGVNMDPTVNCQCADIDMNGSIELADAPLFVNLLLDTVPCP